MSSKGGKDTGPLCRTERFYMQTIPLVETSTSTYEPRTKTVQRSSIHVVAPATHSLGGDKESSGTENGEEVINCGCDHQWAHGIPKSFVERARGSSHGPDVSETFSTRSYSSGVYSTAHKEIRVNASQSS